MTAPPSPALSESSVTRCCSEEGMMNLECFNTFLKIPPGSNGNADCDYCSPELKRAKRLDSAQPSCSRVEESRKKKFLTSNSLCGVKESESRLSFRSVSDQNTCRGLEYNGNSNHSLPTLDYKALPLSNSAQFDRRPSLEDVQVDRVNREDAQFERRPSLDENLDLVNLVETVEMKNVKKTRVVSSCRIHSKEAQQLVGSERGSHKTDLSASIQPSRFADAHKPVFDGFAGNEVLDSETVKVKLGLSEMTYETGQDHIHKILMPAQLETLLASRERYENWSTTTSLQEDDAEQSGLKPTETTELDSAMETVRTSVGNAGDSQTWNSHIEKEYKNELEFSTLVTLAYVRVRDLTNAIDKACSYSETIDKKDSEGAEETNQLRSEIQALFEERANLALEHSKWRTEFSGLYLQRKKVLCNLKCQAALAEETYFKLRKELEDLQYEPIVKPKRTWFSRMCAFIK